MKRIATLFLVSGLAASAWAGKAHEHGIARLDVAIEGSTLTLALETPLDGLIGFERAPRSDAEKRTAEAAIATLRAADTLFAVDPAARCKAASVELSSAPLKLGTTAAAKDDGHGDLDAEFVFRCQSAPAFVEAGLFRAFPRLARIDVQVAAPKGQRKLVLQRPAQRIELPR